jgi:hypothetical protein
MLDYKIFQIIHQTVSTYGSFNACSLKRPFTVPQGFKNDYQWPFHFFVPQTVDDLMLYAAITTLTLSLISVLLII